MCIGLRVDQEGWSSGMWKRAVEGKNRNLGSEHLFVCSLRRVSLSLFVPPAGLLCPWNSPARSTEWTAVPSSGGDASTFAFFLNHHHSPHQPILHLQPPFVLIPLWHTQTVTFSQCFKVKCLVFLGALFLPEGSPLVFIKHVSFSIKPMGPCTGSCDVASWHLAERAILGKVPILTPH